MQYKAEQTQLLEHPVTGAEWEVKITQGFYHTPAIWTHRNGDPGEPESYDEIGDPLVMIVETGEYAEIFSGEKDEWMNKAIDWDSFHEIELTPINDSND